MLRKIEDVTEKSSEDTKLRRLLVQESLMETASRLHELKQEQKDETGESKKEDS